LGARAVKFLLAEARAALFFRLVFVAVEVVAGLPP